MCGRAGVGAVWGRGGVPPQSFPNYTKLKEVHFFRTSGIEKGCFNSTY